jgi:hypothetical protein
MSDTARILERIRKMLALANDSAASEGERDNAMRMAHATLAKYNLDLAMVEKHQQQKKENSEEKRVHQPAAFYGRPWARHACQSIAALCFCHYLYVPATKAKDTRHYFIGRYSNAVSASLLAEYVVNSIMKEGKRGQRQRQAGNEWFRSFSWGAAVSVGHRVTEILAQATKPAEPVSAPGAAPGTPGTAIVLADVYRDEQQANVEYVERTWGKARGRGRGGKSTVDYSAMSEGREYGKKINLNRQVH